MCQGILSQGGGGGGQNRTRERLRGRLNSAQYSAPFKGVWVWVGNLYKVPPPPPKETLCTYGWRELRDDPILIVMSLTDMMVGYK